MAGISLVLFAVFTPNLSSRSGQTLFGAMSWAFFVFCILQGLRETSDSLAQERRDGTLGLLFLTNLRAYDVVLGKLAAATVKSFGALLAMLPAIVLPLWLGGVTAAECFQVAAALGMALLLSMTAGLWISSRSRNAFFALLAGFLVVSLVLLLPVACIGSGMSLPRWTAGPFEMLDGTLKSQATIRSSAFWPATLYSAILCGAFFWMSGGAISRISLAEPIQKSSGWRQKLLRPTLGLRDSWGGTPSDDPAAWLGERTLPGRRLLWILLGLAASASFLLGLFMGNKSALVVMSMQVAFGFLIKLWIAVLAVQPFNSARRSGAFELLLCTPVTPASLVRGQMDALRAYFFAPGFLSAIGLPLVTFLGIYASLPDLSKIAMIPGIVFGLVWFTIFLLDLNALAYAGLWFGLTEPQLPQAVSKTVFRILILPWITLIVPIAGVLGLLIWPWIWLAWAEKRLKKDFYQEAGNPFPMDVGKGATQRG